MGCFSQACAAEDKKHVTLSDEDAKEAARQLRLNLQSIDPDSPYPQDKRYYYAVSQYAEALLRQHSKDYDKGVAQFYIDGFVDRALLSFVKEHGKPGEEKLLDTANNILDHLDRDIPRQLKIPQKDPHGFTQTPLPGYMRDLHRHEVLKDKRFTEVLAALQCSPNFKKSYFNNLF